jgi:glutathione peroxidase
MSPRQFFWKLFYPLTMLFTRNSWRGKMLINSNRTMPSVSFYSLSAVDNKGSEVKFSQFRDRQVLIVNTASDCAYTNQYKELQELQQRFSEELIILAFPSNDFNQEKDDDNEIKAFCANRYNIQFPIIKKSVVTKAAGQHAIFSWLTDSVQNGWNTKGPDWNFCKYLIDKKGVLTHYFGTSLSPVDKLVITAIQANL